MKEENKTKMSDLGVHLPFVYIILAFTIPLFLAYFLLFQIIIKPINYLFGVIRKWR